MAKLRAVVECLLTAHYSPAEIVEYLERIVGLGHDEAEIAVRDVTPLPTGERSLQDHA